MCVWRWKIVERTVHSAFLMATLARKHPSKLPISHPEWWADLGVLNCSPVAVQWLGAVPPPHTLPSTVWSPCWSVSVTWTALECLFQNALCIFYLLPRHTHHGQKCDGLKLISYRSTAVYVGKNSSRGNACAVPHSQTQGET